MLLFAPEDPEVSAAQLRSAAAARSGEQSDGNAISQERVGSGASSEGPVSGESALWLDPGERGWPARQH